MKLQVELVAVLLNRVLNVDKTMPSSYEIKAAIPKEETTMISFTIYLHLWEHDEESSRDPSVYCVSGKYYLLAKRQS